LPNLEELKQARKLVEQVLSEEKKLSRDDIERAIEVYKEVYEYLSKKT